MGRFNPEFIGSIRGIMDSILMFVYEEIQERPDINQDELFNEWINDYYRQRKEVKNPFSDKLIKFVEDFFKKQFEIDRETFKITLKTEEKLIKYCIDQFIEDLSIYDVEISEKDYINYRYNELLRCLNDFKFQESNILNLEKGLISNFGDSWTRFSLTWENFKNNKIDASKTFEIAFEVFGEKTFIEGLLSYKPIEECYIRKFKEVK